MPTNSEGELLLAGAPGDGFRNNGSTFMKTEQLLAEGIKVHFQRLKKSLCHASNILCRSNIAFIACLKSALGLLVIITNIGLALSIRRKCLHQKCWPTTRGILTPWS